MKKRAWGEDELLKYRQRQPGLRDWAGAHLLVHFDSFCLGDTICFSAYLDALLLHHQPRQVTVTTFFPELISSRHHAVEVVSAYLQPGSPGFIETDTLVTVGYDKANLDHTLGGMQWAVKDCLRLPQELAIGRPWVRPRARTVLDGKVAIAPESLKAIARWDWHGARGWQEVIDHLNLKGKEVHMVSYENRLQLQGLKASWHGNSDLDVALGHILESELFIGLSSGLAWLAWAYEVPVVMIAGFTKPHNEFPSYRVIQDMACNGCFNTFTEIRSSCPLFEGTDRANECHTRITPEMVISKIDDALCIKDWSGVL